MRRRVISVTRRHLDFLFNREETVVSSVPKHFMTVTPEQGEFWGLTASEPAFERVLAASIAEGDWQLPPSDESKVGQD